MGLQLSDFHFPFTSRGETSQTPVGGPGHPFMCVCSVVSDSATPWTVACQAPLSVGLPSQEYWSGLPFPSPGGLPDPRTDPASPLAPALASRFFTPEPPAQDCVSHHTDQPGLREEHFRYFLVGSDDKESACNARDLALIPGLERSPEKGMATKSSPLARRIPWTEEPGVHWVKKSRT